jgi:5-methylcytosine-specific restriction endonuclease McrA
MSDEVKTDETEEQGDGLNDRRRAFCREYVIDWNASQAAIRAGYSQDTARSIASQLLTNPFIRENINRLIKQQESKASSATNISIRPKLKAAISEMVGSEGVNRFVEQILIDNIGNDGLLSYIEKRSRHIKSISRYSVLAKSGFKCQACGARPGPDNDITLHIDHIIPFTMGGTSEESNLQVLCYECNISKGNRFAIDHRKCENE